MHVYVLDEENEQDLEFKVNDILLSYNDEDIVDIKYVYPCYTCPPTEMPPKIQCPCMEGCVNNG